MIEKEFIPPSYRDLKPSSKTKWKSPSNIALVKYWGKFENQMPANPSISFTLSNSATTTSLACSLLRRPVREFSFDLLFEGKPKEEFRPKINTFLSRVEPYLPFIKQYHFKIESSNSFPHSSGIASSASSMSALAICLMNFERELVPEMSEGFYAKKASFLARLGSGSACRSIQGPLVQWGRHDDIEGSSDLFGIKYPHAVHEVFNDYQDTILLVDKGEKQVSSSVGHNLMRNHPFADRRFSQANKNIGELKSILAEGNLKKFVALVENEALTLHAMMMTSNPYFILMKPNTLQIIDRIWKFRKSSKTNICFTLDAGANVHVLYPKIEHDKVNKFIREELLGYCENRQLINDEVGHGAQKCL